LVSTSTSVRARDAELTTGGADVSDLLSTSEEMQAKDVYLILEGHRTFPFVGVLQQERRRKALLALLSVSEVSRPLRLRSA